MENFYPSITENEICDRALEGQVETALVMPERWMIEQRGARKKDQPVIALNQLISIHAMISYISAKKGPSEFRLERSLSDHFHVPNVTCLPEADFDEAIRYLADILSN